MRRWPLQYPEGTSTWFEPNTADQAKAEGFYAATVGWTIASSPMAEYGDYLQRGIPTERTPV